MALPAVDLVIVHRETPGPVLRTVADFLDQSLVPRIVVVDNGSTPATVARLRAENERLKIKLAKAEAIIEVQGKVHALLEELSKSADTDDT